MQLLDLSIEDNNGGIKKDNLNSKSSIERKNLQCCRRVESMIPMKNVKNNVRILNFCKEMRCRGIRIYLLNYSRLNTTSCIF